MTDKSTAPTIDSLLSAPPESPDAWLLGRSPSICRIARHVERAAEVQCTVLVSGETGTGKEIWARLLHKLGPRVNKPFVPVNCAALTATLAESQLFGHEKGAFTGATDMRKGAFELANTGTIFLDEIGELPIDLQPKLLRVLENREVRRVGAGETTPVNLRIIGATNRNLMDMVAENKFREDLYFRLAVAKVRVPSLAERRDDIPLLVDHFLETLLPELLPEEEGSSEPRKIPAVTKPAMEALQAHDWPGNVRELRNVIERAVFLSETGTVDLNDIHLDPRGSTGTSTTAPNYELDTPFKDAKNRVIESFERTYLQNLLTTNKGNISRSARQAEIERKYLKDLLRKHGMRSPSGSEQESA